MKTVTKIILVMLDVIFWILFVGFMIQTGALLFNYILSLWIPEASKNLYEGLNLSILRNDDFGHYKFITGIIIGLSGLKSYIFYLTVKFLLKLNRSQPFGDDTAPLLEEIAQVTLVTGLLALMAELYSSWLTKFGVSIKYEWSATQTLFFAAIIYLVAQMQKGGMDMRFKNNLPA